MAYEARVQAPAGQSFYQVDGTVAAFSLRQGPTGLAEIYDKATPASASTYQTFNNTIGLRVTLPKSTSVALLKGGRAYWDRSSEVITYKPVNDRDFYVGRIANDATATTSTVDVLLNVDPPYDIDMHRDGFQTVLVGTPAAGGFGYPVCLGGSYIFELSATSEAQKVDALSVKGFSKDANAIARFKFRVLNDGAVGSQDIAVGVANETHASDFQTVGTFVAMHLDGGTTTINMQSDDTTTDVAPTSTTKTYTEGSDLAVEKEVWLDFRNPNDVQAYVDGELVNDATTFTLAASSATLYPIVHLEKGSGTDVYKIGITDFVVWLAEQ